MSRFVLAALAALFLVAAGVAVNAQTAFNLYTVLTGGEIIGDMANPTGGQFTSKLMATYGLAAVKTTVSGLPTCNAAAKGTLYIVTDATSPTYGGSLTGGSSTIALALCNGSAWVSH